MTDLQIVASLERHMDSWIEENYEDMDVGWCGENASRHMAIAVAQMLWIQRESSQIADESHR